MSNISYQMQQIAADQELAAKYFDAETCHIGQRVDYRDATGDLAGDRGMLLHDDGSGLLIVNARFAVGDRVVDADDDAGRITASCDAGGCDVMVAWDSGVRTPACSADLQHEE